MTRSNTIILSALCGAAVAGIAASYFTTERGRQMLNSASESLKELTSKATELAKNNIGEVLTETKNTVGNVVKEKIAEKALK